ncbi:DUF362 domain-containing protein [Candidatus Woesearchaeota archaeon]|nr:DUF362 domain-containing protein [Candidatus Woesearchaeota archaeon]
MEQGKIKKEVNKEFKVVGVSKVSIPSPFHPIIPYYVLMLEDKNGNRMPKKSMKEYKIGDEYLFSKGDVSIVKQKYDCYEAVKLALELIDDIVVNENSKILIKPSIITATYPYLAVTTNPKVLAATLKILMEKGAKPENITVAEQTPFMPIEISAKKSGIGSVCKKHGVKLMDLAKSEFEIKEGYEISRELFDKDIIINMPAMKTDSRFTISGALENMTRCLSVNGQKKLFKDDIRKSRDVLNKLLPKELVIADAVLSMQGNGPLLGEPGFLNIVMASHDPVAIDEAFCRMILADTPDYVKNTAGNHNPKIGGDELEACRYPLVKAEKGTTPHPDIKILGDSICPICYHSAISAISKLVTSRGEKTYIAIGSEFGKEELSGKARLVALGDEAIGALERLGIEPSAKLSACPPDLVEQVVFIKKIFSSKLEKPKINIIDKAKSAVLKAALKFKK